MHSEAWRVYGTRRGVIVTALSILAVAAMGPLTGCEREPGSGTMAQAGTSGTPTASVTPAAAQTPGQSGTRTPSPPAASPAQAPGNAATGGQSTGPVQVGPVILDPQKVDFGIVTPHTTVTAEVKITNTTDQPLTILDSVPSCQCTSVNMKGVVIPPHETVVMPMSMKTSTTTGIRQAGVRLLIEGYPKVIDVAIQSEVAHAIKATPPFIDVQQQMMTRDGRPLPPMPLSGTLRLESLDGRPFSIVAVHNEPPAFIGFDPAIDSPRSTYEIAWDFRELPETEIPAYVIVETDRPDCPAMEIRVRHELTKIMPPFKLDGFCAGFGRVAPGEPAEFEFGIKDLAPATIAKIGSLSPDATVELLEKRSDQSMTLARVKVTPRPGLEGLLYFPMQITTSDGRIGSLIVYGSVR